ncbi:MAG: hypothetical protein HY290_07350 [Planctomycetia bacterium]|nr:hypothetical protein [Planctomycetia bacterium]
MKRIFLLCLWLCTSACATGCCHSYYSRCNDCDDGYACNHSRKHCRHKHCRGDRGARGGRMDGCDDCCGDCCCDQCCDGGFAGQGMPVDGSAMMSGPGCAGGNCSSTTPTYSGMPFNPGDGWTIQSTTLQPIGNEPFPAPAAANPTPVNPPTTSSQGWTTPSSVPNPAPVPPPVSYNRK